jgi:uncharacterized protein YbjT (DUF2867 family)
MGETRKVLVLGASGLIGRFVTDDLRARGFHVVALARRFSSSQAPGADNLEMPLLAMDWSALARLIGTHGVDVVVNCVGLLQDVPGSDVGVVHRDFVAQLLRAIHECGRPISLVHISIPGEAADDRTGFAITKREAEHLIASSGIAHAILRPGFVIAPAAYGGSAMVRALASLPFQLPAAESGVPFQPVMVEDVSATIAFLASRQIGDKSWDAVVWDLMQQEPVTLGGVIDWFRRSLATKDLPRITIPAFALDIGARLGDFASQLGWTPPIRSTALAELRRGVRGDPSAWMAATGIVPADAARALAMRSATIQDKWFSRLYLIKALVIASLVVFWSVSGFIALFVSYDAATDILRSHALPPALVAPITVLTSVMDITIGVLIAFRRTAGVGLIAGIAASFGYMSGAAILTPDLWIEPLGALVKTGPAVVLMLVGLAILDNR